MVCSIQARVLFDIPSVEVKGSLEFLRESRFISSGRAKDIVTKSRLVSSANAMR